MDWQFAEMFFSATVRTETRRSANPGVTHVPGLPNLDERIYTTVNFREFYAKCQIIMDVFFWLMVFFVLGFCNKYNSCGFLNL